VREAAEEGAAARGQLNRAPDFAERGVAAPTWPAASQYTLLD